MWSASPGHFLKGNIKIKSLILQKFSKNEFSTESGVELGKSPTSAPILGRTCLVLALLGLCIYGI